MSARIGRFGILFILLCFVLFSLIFNNPDSYSYGLQECAPIPDGLISWWPGDGDATDLEGNNDGNPGGGVTYSDGYVNSGFNFAANEAYVRIPDDPNGTSLDGFSELTIEAWIKPNSFGWDNPETGGNTAAILSKYDSREQNGISFSFQLENGKYRFVVLESLSPIKKVGFVSSNDAQLNIWSHVAAVWYGEEDVKIYVNGQVITGTAIAEGPVPVKTALNSVPTNIGRIESFSGSHTGPAGYFDGEIDEISIYNLALSTKEIVSIYNAASQGKCKEIPPEPTTSTPPDGTPKPENYLPSVRHDPTWTPDPNRTPSPTPSQIPVPIPSPTPEPIPRPRLNDGYYRADMGDRGSLWFRVSNNGSTASGGGFSFKAHIWCDWATEIISDQTEIVNGSFLLEEIDLRERSFGGQLSCASMTNNEAFCIAFDPNTDSSAECNSIEGRAKRQ